jgi:hypothetical protein
VAVAEDPEQDQLERVALADDCALDFVEHPRRELTHLFDRHRHGGQG